MKRYTNSKCTVIGTDNSPRKGVKPAASSSMMMLPPSPSGHPASTVKLYSGVLVISSTDCGSESPMEESDASGSPSVNYDGTAKTKANEDEGSTTVRSKEKTSDTGKENAHPSTISESSVAMDLAVTDSNTIWKMSLT